MRSRLSLQYWFPEWTHKFRLAAAAAIIGGVRCHHWQRPLPIMSPPAANLKSMRFSPLRCLPLPVCRAPTLLKAPHFARHQQCSTACHHFFSESIADSDSCHSSNLNYSWIFLLHMPSTIVRWSLFKATYGRMRIII